MLYCKHSNWEMKRLLTSKELLALLEEDSDCENADTVDVVYVPPEVDEMTDEENIDDNLIEEGNIDGDIAGTYEIHAHGNLESEDSEDDNIPLKQVAKKMKRKHMTDVPKWKKSELPTYSAAPENSTNRLLEDIKKFHGGKSPLEIFSLFFDDDVVNQIVHFTKLYASQNNRHDFTVNELSLKRFLGICILSGYHTLPQTDMYWSKDEDKQVNIVRETMSRNRFRAIKQNIHLSDNTRLDKKDKFSKLRPIFDIMNRNFMQFGVFEHNLSIDEEMVPYFGRHSCKMFIRGKPVRFGFKLWCLCSHNGYLYKFIPYGGKVENVDKHMALGTRVVLDLLSVVENPERHRIFFDNFFSSYSLFATLKEKGYFATGTVRENRVPKCPIDSKKNMSKQKRGSYVCAFDPNLEVLVVQWNDNSVVTVMTNACTVLPLVQAKRFNRKEHKEEAVPQPNVISEYKYMGGVDLHDNGIANYRIKIRGKKWWWPLFINMIDSAIVNSWKIFKIANNSNISQLTFRSSLVLSLLKFEGKAELKNVQVQNPCFPLGSFSRHSLPDDIRFDNIGHLIKREENNSRKKCKVCKSNTIYLCKKCKIHLHPDCFETFHVKT